MDEQVHNDFIIQDLWKRERQTHLCFDNTVSTKRQKISGFNTLVVTPRKVCINKLQLIRK